MIEKEELEFLKRIGVKKILTVHLPPPPEDRVVVIGAVCLVIYEN